MRLHARGGPRAEAVPSRHPGPRRHPCAGTAERGSGALPPRGRHPAEERGADPLPRNLAGAVVVVVDDDPSTLEYFAATLRACGASVLAASSAREALRLVVQAGPHAVVSDIAMPSEDGYWLIHEIRDLPDPVLRRTPVVAATAYGREHSRDRTLAAGFTDHLAKPVDPVLLCRAVAAALGR